MIIPVTDLKTFCIFSGFSVSCTSQGFSACSTTEEGEIGPNIMILFNHSSVFYIKCNVPVHV